MVKAVYPGSFDPVTNGHIDVIKRAAAIVDEVVVGILVNKGKTPLFTTEERYEMLKKTVNIPNVTVKVFDGTTVDFAKENDAKIIVRGLRAVTDYEIEMQIAQTNRQICEHIETLFLITSLEYAFLSSTIVKEIASFGEDVSKWVPKEVEAMLKKRFS